jgi:hypothetical protein
MGLIGQLNLIRVIRVVFLCWSSDLGMFVAVAQSGTVQRVMYSTNGTAWSAAGNSIYSFTSVCWSSDLGMFVAVFSNGGSTATLYYSTNGTTWTNVGVSGATQAWQSVCWSSDLGLFIAVSNTVTDKRVMTSPNGINWSISDGIFNNSWSSVCYGDGLVVAVSTTGD